MTKSRFLPVFLVAALAALIILISYSSGLPGWLSASALGLFFGVCLGLLLRKRAPATLEARGPDQENRSGKMAAIDFSSNLLDATVNEMREGLLIIDADMRVVASNRAARNLSSLVDDTINMRRLTELTRNPAIYDAFLDAVRGTERVGVKVETYDQAKRIFDLR